MSEKFNTESCRGNTNMLLGEKFNTAILAICEDISTVLTQYCGPYSGFATLFSQNEVGKLQAKFTKDGINILQSLEYANPIDNHILSMLKTIGKGMEMIAGDGTTSAVLLCIFMMQRFRERLGNTTYRSFMDGFVEMTGLLEEALSNEMVLAKNKHKDQIYNLAWQQAMTSSHGDRELSGIIAELYSTIPERAWDTMVYRMEARETNQRIRLEYDESSYRCQAHACNPEFMNNNSMGTSADHTGTLIVPPTELADGSLIYEALLSKIHNLKPGDPSLTIVMGQPDGHVYKELDGLVRAKYRENCSLNVYFLPDKSIHSHLTDLEAIYVCAGMQRQECYLSGTWLERENVRTVWNQPEKLYIYNISEYDTFGYHTGLDNPFSPISRFFATVEQIKAQLESELSPTRYTQDHLRTLADLRNKMEFSKTGTIVIGGNVYEQVALQDVIEDVLKAVSITLREGVLLGGFRSFIQAVDTLQESPTLTPITTLILQILKESVMELNTILVKSANWECSDPHLHDGRYNLNVIEQTLREFTCDNVMNTLNEDDPFVLQSYVSYKEFLKRFGDVIPRIIFSTGMCVPNAVNNAQLSP